ncbi:MAG: hypothetical protein U1E45_15655 [Geminicoccaceae bacterium]
MKTSEIRKLPIWALVLTGIVLFWSYPSQAAEFWFEPIEDGTDIAVLTLYGEIVDGDAERFLNALVASIKERGQYIDKVNLFSPGGNAAEGILIGRIINKYYLATEAPTVVEDDLACFGHPGNVKQPFNYSKDRNCICASACAIAWLGGIERYGVAGFHRVYSVDPTVSASRMKEMRRFFDTEIDDYLAEVAAPSFVKELIERSDQYGLSFPTEAQQAALLENVDHANTVYAGCQAFNMSTDQKTNLLELRQKSDQNTLDANEQKMLDHLELAYEQRSLCREQIRRRELYERQSELQGE